MQWGSGSNWDSTSQRNQVRNLSGTISIGASSLGKNQSDMTAARQTIADNRKQQMFEGAVGTMRSGLDWGKNEFLDRPPVTGSGTRVSSGGLTFTSEAAQQRARNDKLGAELERAKIAALGNMAGVGPSIFAQKSGGGGGGGSVLEWPEDKHKRDMEMQALKDRGQIGQASATAEGQVASERTRARGLLDLQRQTARDQRSGGEGGGESVFSGVDSLLKD